MPPSSSSAPSSSLLSASASSASTMPELQDEEQKSLSLSLGRSSSSEQEVQNEDQNENEDEDEERRARAQDADQEAIMEPSRRAVEAARNDNSGRVYRVYCDGIFDLFHLGHMNMLRQAKHALGDPSKTHLIVGVCSDALTHQHKGKTVLDDVTRVQSVQHCRWVDEVAPDAPWVLSDAFLYKYQIDFVAHDAIPYVSADSEDVYAHVKRRGMFLETQRTEGISTSDLIVQIVRDYDEYVERNLSRGYTPQDLNLGKTYRVRRIEHQKREAVQEALRSAKNKGKELRDTAAEFAQQFAPNGASLTQYRKRLQQEVPKASGGVARQLWGLILAICLYLQTLCSWVNPATYVGTKPVLVCLVILVVALLLARLS